MSLNLSTRAVILHPLGRLGPVVRGEKLFFKPSKVDRVFVNLE